MKKLLSAILAITISAACAFPLFACGKQESVARWLTGSSAPTSETGVNGDVYFDTATRNVYVKNSSGWVILGNLGGGVTPSVSGAHVDGDGNLIITLSDGRTVNCGKGNFNESLHYTAIYEEGEIVAYGVRGIGSMSVSEITVPATYMGVPVTRIEDEAFYNVNNITRVTLPGTIKYIGEGAFMNCDSLVTVDIKNGVEYIGDNAFSYCVGLQSIIIPATVKEIGDDVFAGCTSLVSATIEPGVEKLGSGLFSGCTSLASFTMPDSVSELGSFTFMGCWALKEARLSDSLTTVPEYTFGECPALEKVHVSDHTTEICYSAFYLDAALKSLVLPATLTRIESYGIYRVELETIFFKGTEEQWSAIETGRAPVTIEPLSLGGVYETEGGEEEGDNKKYSIEEFLASVDVYFYNAAEPVTEGKYWHYVDGVPTKW